MKTKSALIGTLIALFFVIFAGLVFLPAVLSSDLLKPRILQEVNRHLEGQLQVSQWKFKWFSGIEAKGITYDHRQQNFILEVAELKGYRGLVHLIADPGNLGAIELLKPDVLFYLSDKIIKDACVQEIRNKGIVHLVVGHGPWYRIFEKNDYSNYKHMLCLNKAGTIFEVLLLEFYFECVQKTIACTYV